MTIHPAAGADWTGVGRLADLLVRTHHDFDKSRFVAPGFLPQDAYTARLRDETSRGHAIVLVAHIDDAVVGYVFAGVEPENWKELRHEAGYIHDLVVAPEQRRSGIGAALVEGAIGWFRARGIARVMLWTAWANVDAQQLFRRVGFRPTMIEMTLEDR
jgi:GNAT superfamily N-acetyltransferase